MTAKEKMNTHRKTAIIVGVLFLTAMVTSLLGGIWLESILNAPDYLITVSANETQVIIGVLLISISAGMILALPIILNEIFLGIWLIVRGFNSSAIASESA